MQMPDRALAVVKQRLRARRLGLQAGAYALVAVVGGFAAVWIKEGRFAPPLAAVSMDAPSPAINATAGHGWLTESQNYVGFRADAGTVEFVPVSPNPADANIRWFNGRPVRPVGRMTMTVTAYSPDANSCGDSADGLTATLHNVSTNASVLVAADPRVLRYGSMISVPGYDNGQIVPVLDCGGKIRGRRLDVLFPTHEQAKAWGVRRLEVVVWGYADGKPAVDPRRLR
ncbi:MAG: 3D domain-containing protein [Phycisphaerales bacterium]|nr:3D domain-containing protein [Phycisphaerales bacterium]